VRIRVADTGIGFLPAISTVFSSGSTEWTRRVHGRWGTGLGLSIVRHIVDRMGELSTSRANWALVRLSLWNCRLPDERQRHIPNMPLPCQSPAAFLLKMAQ